MILPCYINSWEYPCSLGRGSCIRVTGATSVSRLNPFLLNVLLLFCRSRLSTSFRALWNQALTTIKFCNPFVLIFIQIAGGVHPPGSVRVATAQSVADAQNGN